MKSTNINITCPFCDKQFIASIKDFSKEPLIKDKKIRKAVRAWAELNNAEELHQFNNYQLEDNNNYIMEFADDCFTNLEVGKNYTIAELCGEGE